jgi:hypothetical protein
MVPLRFIFINPQVAGITPVLNAVALVKKVFAAPSVATKYVDDPMDSSFEAPAALVTATRPMQMFEDPVVVVSPAETPTDMLLEPEVKLNPAEVPKITLLVPDVKKYAEVDPTLVLLAPVTIAPPIAADPTAVFALPLVLNCNATLPMAVLSDPVVAPAALYPIAVQPVAVATANNAVRPTAVLFDPLVFENSA